MAYRATIRGLSGRSIVQDGWRRIMMAICKTVLSRAFGSQSPLVFTFGSLHVGDQSFATAYNSNVPHTYRIANLCDSYPAWFPLSRLHPLIRMSMSDCRVRLYGKPGTIGATIHWRPFTSRWCSPIGELSVGGLEIIPSSRACIPHWYLLLRCHFSKHK